MGGVPSKSFSKIFYLGYPFKLFSKIKGLGDLSNRYSSIFITGGD
jgi:hypothetical protein